MGVAALPETLPGSAASGQTDSAKISPASSEVRAKARRLPSALRATKAVSDPDRPHLSGPV